MLVVTELDRLARSLRDATDTADEGTKKGVALNLGGAVYDPTDPVARLLLTSSAWSPSSRPTSSVPAPE